MAYQGNRSQTGGERRFRKESDYDKSIVEQAMASISEPFNRIGQRSGLSAEEEFAYVWTIFTSNLSLLEKACNEPEQLKRALLTGAGVGLTLDPGRQYAYLTVRRGKLIYDVSYRGLIKLAVDEGLVAHVKPELVHEKDTFQYRGPHERPVHTSSSFFGDRGPVVGGYCEAVLPDGSIVIETMRESEFVEIAALNQDSDAWKKDFSSGEMRKKTVVKRAAKWWYNSAVAGGKASARMEQAIAYLNNEGGEGVTTASGVSAEPAAPEPPRVYVEAEVSAPAVLEHIDKVIARAGQSGGWAAARQYLNGRLKGDDLGYALQKLAVAEQNAGSANTSRVEAA